VFYLVIPVALAPVAIFSSTCILVIPPVVIVCVPVVVLVSSWGLVVHEFFSVRPAIYYFHEMAQGLDYISSDELDEIFPH
jgi:hypothetical protein